MVHRTTKNLVIWTKKPVYWDSSTGKLRQKIGTVFLKSFSPIIYRCLDYIKVMEVKHNSSHD